MLLSPEHERLARSGLLLRQNVPSYPLQRAPHNLLEVPWQSRRSLDPYCCCAAMLLDPDAWAWDEAGAG